MLHQIASRFINANWRWRRDAIRTTFGCGIATRSFIDTDDKVTDVNLVAVFDDQWARNLAPIYVCAVGALEINDDELAVLKDNASMALRNVTFG